MKRLLILIFAALTLCGCGEKAPEDSAPVEQTQRRKAEDSNDGAWARDLPAAAPESAALIRRTKYDAEGNVLSWIDYTLNADGRPIKATPHSSSGVLSDEDHLTTYEYSNGYLVAQNDYSADGEKLLYRRRFDQGGRETKWIIYNEEGKVELWYEKSYDQRGECVSHLLCREGEVPTVMNLREYDYDDNGQISRCRYLSEGGSVIHIYDYSYTLDAAGRVTEYSQYDSSARLLVEAFRYYYDEQGRMSFKEQVDETGRVLIRSAYTYDQQGRILRELLYSSDGALAVTMENSYR